MILKVAQGHPKKDS